MIYSLAMLMYVVLLSLMIYGGFSFHTQLSKMKTMWRGLKMQQSISSEEEVLFEKLVGKISAKESSILKGRSVKKAAPQAQEPVVVSSPEKVKVDEAETKVAAISVDNTKTIIEKPAAVPMKSVDPAPMYTKQPSSLLDIGTGGLLLAGIASAITGLLFMQKLSQTQLESEEVKASAEEEVRRQAKDKMKALEEAKSALAAKSKAEEEAKAATIARSRAEEETKTAVSAKSKAEDEAKSAVLAKNKAEAEARAAVAAKAKAEEDAKTAAAGKAKAEEAARDAVAAKSKAEEEAKAALAAKAKADEGAAAAAAAKDKAESEARAAVAAKSAAEEKAASAVTAMAKAEEEAKAALAGKSKAEEEANAALAANAKAEDEAKAAAAAMSKAEADASSAGAAKARAEGEAQTALAAKSKAEEEAKVALAVKAKAEEQAKAAAAAMSKAEAEADSAGAAKAKAEEEARAALAAKNKAEEEVKVALAAKSKAEEEVRGATAAKSKAEEEVKVAQAAKGKAEEDAKAAVQAKSKAEEEARSALAAKTKAEDEVKVAVAAKTRAEEEAKAAVAAKNKAEEEAKAAVIAKKKAEEETKTALAAKSKAEEAVAKVSTQAEDAIAQRVAEYDQKISRVASLEERTKLEIERNAYRKDALQELRNLRSKEARKKAGIVDPPASATPEPEEGEKAAPKAKKESAVVKQPVKILRVESSPDSAYTGLVNEKVKLLKSTVMSQIAKNAEKTKAMQAEKVKAKVVKSESKATASDETAAPAQAPETTVKAPPAAKQAKPSAPVEASKEVGSTNNDLDAALDEMEAAAELNIPSGKDGVSSEKVLNEMLMVMTKVPIAKFRVLLKTYGGDNFVAPTSNKVEPYLEAAIPVIWKASGKDWNSFIALMRKEINPVAEENDKFMQATIMAAQTLTDSKLKDLIKKYASAGSVPKPSKKETVEESKALDRMNYLSVFLDILRVKFENDYGMVHRTVQTEIEATVKSKSKGFGAGKKAAA